MFIFLFFVLVLAFIFLNLTVFLMVVFVFISFNIVFGCGWVVFSCLRSCIWLLFFVAFSFDIFSVFDVAYRAARGFLFVVFSIVGRSVLFSVGVLVVVAQWLMLLCCIDRFLLYCNFLVHSICMVCCIVVVVVHLWWCL